MKSCSAMSPLAPQSHVNEYIIITYNGKQATKENSKKFDPGVTLRLLSIGMLIGAGSDDSRYNFGSLKKRRVGDKK